MVHGVLGVCYQRPGLRFENLLCRRHQANALNICGGNMNIVATVFLL